jgi:hypothetical protein
MQKKKIITRIYGGIGNQLFIYAASRRLALYNDCELVIDNVSGFINDKFGRKYELDKFNIKSRLATKKERFEPFSKIRRFLVRRFNSILPFHKRNYIQQNSYFFEQRLINLKINGCLVLEGYWQSEDYFIDYEETIRQELSILSPSDPYNITIQNEIFSKKSVAIHIRFFNNPLDSNNYNASCDYYTKAIKLMDQINSNAHYFVFSDNLELALKTINLPLERCTLVNQNNLEHSYLDLWLMSSCENFIIANSTFSWWGAWLSKHPNKIIIAPNMNLNNPNGLTYWNVQNQIPKSWILI